MHDSDIPTESRGRRPLMSIAEVAELLGVSVRHVRRLVEERRMPFFKWGHLLRFDPDEIESWLQRCHVPTSSRSMICGGARPAEPSCRAGVSRAGTRRRAVDRPTRAVHLPIGHAELMEDPDRGASDPRSALCHVCGSTQFKYVDDSHIRCDECGHGASVMRLTATASPDPSPAALSEAKERLRAHDAEVTAAFTGAPFRPYAIDDRWSGLRSFAGHGSSGDRTTRLSLAFSEDPQDVSLPYARVETRCRVVDGIDDPAIAAKMGAFTLARVQVEQLWRGTGVLRDDVRASLFSRERAWTDPTAAWERTQLIVDGDAVEFAVLSEGEHWVAQAIIRGMVVGIQSRKWTLETTGLVTESNFEPYEVGAQELRRRRAL